MTFAACTHDSDCPSQHICFNLAGTPGAGFCLALHTDETTRHHACTDDSDCKISEICFNLAGTADGGFCVGPYDDETGEQEKSHVPITVPHRPCTHDSDCPSQHICFNLAGIPGAGFCLALHSDESGQQEASPVVARFIFRQPCTHDSDCRSDHMCFNLAGTPGDGFCIAKPDVTTTAVVPGHRPRPRCLPGWTWYPDDDLCFLPIYGRLPYTFAEHGCRAWNATVAAPRNALQNSFIKRTYMKYNKTGGPYWIGVRKLSGTWMVPMLNNATAARYGYHPFGYQPAVYTNWRSSQPDGCCGRNVTCVLANLKNGFGQWDDAFCDRVRTSPAGVVCQRYAYQPV